jgi:hypothetical protein
LLAQLTQRVDRFLVQRHMTGLATLCIGTLDGEQSAVEVDGSPTQLEDLTSTKSGVHGEQYGGCQVISKVRELREWFLLPELPPCIARGAQTLQFLIACLHGFPKSRFFNLIHGAVASQEQKYYDSRRAP